LKAAFGRVCPFCCSGPSAASAPQQQSLRVQRLKDIALQKEVLKDITAAEFALKVEIKNGESTIDYDRLVFALDARQELMEQRGVQTSEAMSLLERLARTREGLLETKRASGPGKLQQQLQPTTPTNVWDSHLPLPAPGLGLNLAFPRTRNPTGICKMS
jgi:hypothetical protein